ncbi:hypothetical protein M405DRAFT_878000 [Rhizopogon salebrosus TDB-379]|nr:hypothetical protein M405DRAFT_878000 [Rhizopogon salebrosus TDB-379]
MEGVVDAQRDALPENRLYIAEYLNSSITGIRKLVHSLAELDSEASDSDLAQLSEMRRKAQEEDLAHKLDGVKYEIDSPDSIQLFGSGRIENIMKLAGTVILVEREFQSAVQSIQNIFEGVDLRVKQLSVTFRQQGADPKARFTLYVHGLTDIRKLVHSLAELDSEVSDSDLAQLAERRRKAQEEDLARKLDVVKYGIDSPDSIQLFGSGRIENRHLQIMKLAGTVILTERELQSAAQSIKNIFEGVDQRVKQLSVTFRQQGADPKARFTLYAHGLYNIWYSPDLIPDDIEYWTSNNVGSDDTELEIDTKALKFGPFSLPEAGGQLERPIQLAPLSSSEEPRDAKEEYMRLWCLNELHNQCWVISAPPLSPEENRRFDTLSKVSPPEDVKCWSSLHQEIDLKLIRPDRYGNQNTLLHLQL